VKREASKERKSIERKPSPLKQEKKGRELKRRRGSFASSESD
jgi:hypothetical protein